MAKQIMIVKPKRKRKIEDLDLRTPTGKVLPY